MKIFSFATYEKLSRQGIDDKRLTSDPGVNLLKLDSKAEKALIKNLTSPLPLHKSLVLLECLNDLKQASSFKYGLLALGNAL